MSRSRPARFAPAGRRAPYDVILLQGASEVAPDSLLAQLAEAAGCSP
jgi:protein-L-isoaspartate O-methyltransferase